MGGALGSTGGAPAPHATDGEDMRPCTTCGRSFRASALARHAKVCEKVFVNKRKQFDMKAARLAGMEGAEEPSKKEVARRARATAPPRRVRPPSQAQVLDDRSAEAAGAKKPDWKKKSEAFQRAMRAGRCALVSAV